MAKNIKYSYIFFLPSFLASHPQITPFLFGSTALHSFSPLVTHFSPSFILISNFRPSLSCHLFSLQSFLFSSLFRFSLPVLLIFSLLPSSYSRCFHSYSSSFLLIYLFSLSIYIQYVMSFIETFQVEHARMFYRSRACFLRRVRICKCAE